MATRLRRLALIGALAATLLCVFSPAGLATAASAGAPPLVGVDGSDLFGMPRSAWDGFLSEMVAAHVQFVREDAAWEAVQPSAPTAKGPGYNWAWTDAIASALARHRLQWLPIIDYSTSWSASYSQSDGLLKPRQPDLLSPPKPVDVPYFAAYAAAFVKRYGPGGSFWAANPRLRPEPVTQVQIWNEPNANYFWMPSPDAQAYASLYEQARSAILAAAPKVKVAVGALGNPSWTFLDQLFSALGGARDVAAVADTPYASRPEDVVDNVAGLRRALDAHGDRSATIQVSEFGWPTRGSESFVATLTDPGRATALVRTMQMLATGNYGVSLIAPYTWVTPQQDPNNAEDWYGIVNADGSQTASSLAYAAEAKRIEALAASVKRSHKRNRKHTSKQNRKRRHKRKHRARSAKAHSAPASPSSSGASGGLLGWLLR